jgi:hypothetical protein
MDAAILNRFRAITNRRELVKGERLFKVPCSKFKVSFSGAAV